MDPNNMDFPTTASTSPLKGPRPARLKVGGPSHKIKKPPSVPAPAEGRHLYHHHQHQDQPQQRQPVIIYSVSPKAIHTNPNEFMSVVQRLTGVNSSPSTVATAAATGVYPYSPVGIPRPSGQLSPAAKLATVERAQQHTVMARPSQLQDDLSSVVAQSNFSGVLSPNPSSLLDFSEYLFPPAAEANSLGFFQDMMTLSPSMAFNRSFIDNVFLQSPTFPSPNWDTFSGPSYPPEI